MVHTLSNGPEGRPHDYRTHARALVVGPEGDPRRDARATPQQSNPIRSPTPRHHDSAGRQMARVASEGRSDLVYQPLQSAVTYPCGCCAAHMGCWRPCDQIGEAVGE